MHLLCQVSFHSQCYSACENTFLWLWSFVKSQKVTLIQEYFVLCFWILMSLCWCVWLQMEYERQVASVRAQNALEGDFSISQAEMSSRQAMLENASDIKVTFFTIFSMMTKFLKSFKLWEKNFACCMYCRNGLYLCPLAGEVQHICPWQGAFCQRWPSDCGRKTLWFGWTKWVNILFLKKWLTMNTNTDFYF